jgi:hypothetical protein
VLNLSADDETVEVNESVEFTAAVENTGSAQRTATVELVTLGEVVGSQNLTLASGTVQTVTFTHTYDALGTYIASVGSQEIQVQVGSEGGNETTTPETTGNGDSLLSGTIAAVIEATNGLVIVVGVVAVIALGIIAIMRL